MRKIIQITSGQSNSYHVIYALCDDGTMFWSHCGTPLKWNPCAPIPQRVVEAVENVTQEPTITEAEIREMMSDPRYWRDRQPEFVQRVTDGFRALVGMK